MKESSIMVQQRKFIQLPLVGAILFCLLVGVYLFASKRFSKPGEPAGVVKHKVDVPAEEALKYWTEEKMRKAKPAKMPKVKARALKRGKKDQQGPPA